MKKVLGFRFAGRTLEFAVSQRLFSSHRIDRGSELLLRAVAGWERSDGSLLDVGCGYGVLGLSLLAARYAGRAELVDRDALAVRFARENAERNGLREVAAYGSLGTADVEARGFARFVSNLPGTAGEPVLRAILAGARARLAPGGLGGVVVVAPLGDWLREAVEETGGLGIVGHEVHAEHEVFLLERAGDAAADPDDDADPEAPYLRGELPGEVDGKEYVLDVARGLADFEQPGHGTRLLLEAIASHGGSAETVVLFEPGVGHLAVAASLLHRPPGVELVGADLLALRFSRRNLLANGYPGRVVCTHDDAWRASGPGPRLVVASLHGDESQAETDARAGELADALGAGGSALVAGGSTSVARLATSLRRQERVRVAARRKRRGFAVLHLAPR